MEKLLKMKILTFLFSFYFLFRNKYFNSYHILTPFYLDCPLCTFHPKNNLSNSSPKDLIVTMALKKLYNLSPWIRSLKTTGCKASIIVFSDSQTIQTLNKDTLSLMKNCNISLYDVGLVSHLNQNQIYFYRFIILKNYLKNNILNYNRVFLADLYDTIFQGDPFNIHFCDDTMYFIDEGFNIGDDNTNMEWIKRIPSANIELFLSKPVLCGGMTWGGTLPFLAFIDGMESLINMTNFHVPTVDQGLLNYLVHSNLINRYLKKYQIMPPNNGITTLGVCFKKYSYQNSLGDIYHIASGNYLTVIHQFDRSKEMTLNILRSCPRGKLNIINYMRAIPDYYIY